jgi:O-glycosyl hydrolase
MRAEAWLDWQVAGGGIWGVIDYTRSSQASRMNKKGHAYAQFSRFIRPGSLILGSDNPNTLAALVPANGTLVLVAVNAGMEAAEYVFDLNRFQSLPVSARPYRTSASEDLARLAEIPVTNKTVSVQAPPRSITTLVLGSALTSGLGRPSRRGGPFHPGRTSPGMGGMPWFTGNGGRRFDVSGRRLQPAG